MPLLRFFLFVLVFASSAFAQAPAARPAGSPVVLPEVLADRRVTFRLRAPGATKVEVAFEPGATTPMVKGAEGDWSLTLGPLEPEIYRYTFLVDGLRIADPVNAWIAVGRSSSSSLFEIPGSPARFDEVRPGARGTLHILHYHSAVLGVARRVFVHTPVAYDSEPAHRFPVLYLRHGNGGLEGTWSEVGRAGVILDNLVAEGRAVPMIIVMPNGYAEGAKAAAPVTAPWFGADNATSQELLDDIIPFIEQKFRVLPGPEQRAIAGFSMGAAQALFTGLTHPERFAWVAAFSTGRVGAEDFDLTVAVPGFLEAPAATNARLRLLFLSCGTEDPHFAGYLRGVETLKQYNIRHEWLGLPGAHEMKVWRQSLAALLPKLFQPPR